MVIKSLDDTLNEFNQTKQDPSDLKYNIAIPVPKDYKERYNKIQQNSSRQFCKTLREIIMTAIDKTDQKAS